MNLCFNSRLNVHFSLQIQKYDLPPAAGLTPKPIVPAAPVTRPGLLSPKQVVPAPITIQKPTTPGIIPTVQSQAPAAPRMVAPVLRSKQFFVHFISHLLF